MLSERGYKYKKENESKVKFDLRTMTWFCQYALSENACIKFTGLSNLRTLLKKSNPEIYTHEPEILERYNFCLDVLNARLDKKLTKREYYVADAMGVVENKYPDINPNDFYELNTNDADWIQSTVISSYLNTSDMINLSSELKSVCITLDTSDASDLQKNASKLQELILDASNKIRKNTVISGDLNSMNISNPDDERVDDILTTIRKPTHLLRTGMQAFNGILGGGFEAGRVYSVFGLAGEGKSTLLKNLAYQVAVYNKGYECRDKTKKPCIIYLSMENQPIEEYQTMYNIAGYTDDLKDPNGPSIDTVKANMRNSGWGANKPGDITVWLEYAPINSVDTSYLTTLVEKYEELGYETIAVFQDYIKRIRPVDGNRLEERYRLGNIVNEFKNFAIQEKVPVITASQLNREAARTVDDTRKNGNFESMMNGIGRANIGESSLIDENLDATILLAPCIKDDTKYLGIKITKHRYKINPDACIRFYQPFVQGNPVKLVEDVGCFNTAAVLNLSGDTTSIFGGDTNTTAKTMDTVDNTPKADTFEFGNYIKKEDNVPKQNEVKKVNNNSKVEDTGFDGGFISNVPTKPELRQIIVRVNRKVG